MIMLAGLASCGSGQSTTNPGVSSGNASGVSEKKTDANARNLSRDQELFSKGIDFAASGNNPSWTLEIENKCVNCQYRFSSLCYL